MIRLFAGALCYAGAYHFAYVSYVNPTFEYAHYEYFPPSAPNLLATYFLLIAPLLAYRRSSAPALFGVSLVYALGYVPGLLTLLFCWERGALELLGVQAVLAASMCMLFAAARLGVRAESGHYQVGRIAFAVQALTLACIVLLVLVYRDYMRIVSFADVYDLRFETAAIETAAIIGYLLSWLTYCFLPFLVARSLLRGSLTNLLWALLGSVLIYAATGAKSALLLPLIVVAMYGVMGRRSGSGLLARLLWCLAVAIMCVVVLLPDDGPWIWVKSLLLLRTLATGGWVLSTYYEYFSENGYTLYTHIGPVQALTGAYPYGDLSLGQVIGRAFVGSADANFNANFWASDGFAALGLAGIPIVTAGLSVVLYLINRVSFGFSYRFVALWMTGFWFALLNMPLTTALLSGGGLVCILLMWSARLRWRAGQWHSVRAAPAAA